MATQRIDNGTAKPRTKSTFINHLQRTQGRVRTKTVKKASKVLIEKYYPRLTLDFQTNKKIASEVAIIPSKRLRNKIAGFTTHLMKRIQRGPVR
ncbi:40S ribosomal protein S17, partial [Podila humilis]